VAAVSAEIERLALDVLTAHDCHTVILYGSRARGDATPRSDVDLLCVRDEGPSLRDARVVEGLYLDAFVYGEAALATIDPALLRVRGGVVIRERQGYGARLLEQIEALYQRGPLPVPEDERRALTVWARKMLDRIAGRSDVERDYRRMFLLVRALEDYFGLRNIWYGGEKEALAWLRQHDGQAYALFERAGRSDAAEDEVGALIEAVYGISRPRDP
jgi:predicted nucleotidyltransferase